MSTVADVLRSKGREIYSINAERSVYEAVEQMVACDVAALVVTDDQSELAGIISQRDFANKVVLCDRSPKAVKVKEVMTQNVMSVRDETPTSTCMDIMSQRISIISRSLTEQPVAVVTAGDLFKFVVSEQSMASKSLRNSSSMSKGVRARQIGRCSGQDRSKRHEPKNPTNDATKAQPLHILHFFSEKLSDVTG